MGHTPGEVSWEITTVHALVPRESRLAPDSLAVQQASPAAQVGTGRGRGTSPGQPGSSASQPSCPGRDQTLSFPQTRY